MLNRSVSLSNGIFHSPPSLTTTTTPPPPPPPPSSSSHPSTLSTTPLLPRPSFSSSSPSSLSLLPRFQMEQPPLPLSSSTKKTHSRLPAWWVHYRWILGFSIFILLPSLVLLFVYHQTLLNVLAQFASFVRGSPRLGTLVCMLILFLSAFPPILGFSTYFALFGFIFGFPWGFFPAYLAALSGACVCFFVSRRYFTNYAHRYSRSNRYAKAFKYTLEKRGLKLLVLIRLAPYPFNYTNVVLATTHLPFPMFFKATAFGLLKNLVHVSVGASLSQFNQVSQSPTQLTLLLFSLFMGLGVTFYLWKYVQRILVLDAHERGGTGGGGGVEGGVVVVGSSQGGGGGGGVGERGRLEERGGFEGDPGSLRWQ